MTNWKIANIGIKTCVALTLAAFGGLGCDTGNGATDTTSAALRAASPACVTARDACKASMQPIVAGIETACAPAEAACGHQGAGGASGADCSAARASCEAAIAAAKPILEAAGAACEQSVRSACVVSLPDVGAPARGEHEHDGGLRGGRGEPQESAACAAAETACQQTLASLRSMPPATCSGIGTACSGQTPSTATDACKTAIGDCRSQLEAAGATAHQGCGGDIVAACGGHGG